MPFKHHSMNKHVRGKGALSRTNQPQAVTNGMFAAMNMHLPLIITVVLAVR